MSKAYQNAPRQVTAPARLPGLGAPLAAIDGVMPAAKTPVPELPADTPNLFDSADVMAALDVWDTGRKANKSREMIMREIMMLALAIAAVNLGVNPEAAG